MNPGDDRSDYRTNSNQGVPVARHLLVRRETWKHHIRVVACQATTTAIIFAHFCFHDFVFQERQPQIEAAKYTACSAAWE
jgi:hypothetical protein